MPRQQPDASAEPAVKRLDTKLALPIPTHRPEGNQMIELTEPCGHTFLSVKGSHPKCVKCGKIEDWHTDACVKCEGCGLALIPGQATRWEDDILTCQKCTPARPQETK